MRERFKTFTFPAAGTYRYVDGPGHRHGAVEVVLEAPAHGHVGSPIQVTWATAGAPGGMVFDVEVRQPGQTSFTDFRSGTGTHGAMFTPKVAGTWRFRARMRAPGGEETGFSPVAAIRVS